MRRPSCSGGNEHPALSLLGGEGLDAFVLSVEHLARGWGAPGVRELDETCPGAVFRPPEYHSVMVHFLIVVNLIVEHARGKLCVFPCSLQGSYIPRGKGERGPM